MKAKSHVGLLMAERSSIIMKITKAKQRVSHFWILLGVLILQLSFISVGKCTLTITGPVGVTFYPDFPPSVPPPSATAATYYTYQWCCDASGEILTSTDGACGPYPDSGFVQVGGKANTTQETTVAGGDDISIGAFQMAVYTTTMACGSCEGVSETYVWSPGSVVDGTNTTTRNEVCSDNCGSTIYPCLSPTNEFLWAPFCANQPDQSPCTYPCSSNLTSVTYQATNSSGDLLWQISFTYPTSSCWFEQQGYIDDCCDNSMYQPFIRGASAYFSVSVYMAAGVTPPPLSSFGIYTGSMRLCPGFVNASDGNTVDNGGGGIWLQPPWPNQPAAPAPNGPLGRNISGGGMGHFLYIKEDGSVWAWGNNSYGQLGAATNVVQNSTNAILVNGVSGVMQVSAGKVTSYALMTNGSVSAWGYFGGSVTPSVGVAAQTTQGTNPLGGVIQVAASFSGNSCYALLTNGTVWSWGDNSFGQLGLGGASGSATVAFPITNLSGVVCIAAGTTHALALTTNGTVYSWGDNRYGELGNGGSGSIAVPTLVTNLTNLFIVEVAAGYNTSYAIDNTGNVWAWGANNFGQLGNGTNVTSTVPVPVTGLGGTNAIIGISPGSSCCLAEAFDGSYWAWGANSSGQLGDGTTTTSFAPEHLLFSDGSSSIGISAGGSGASFSIQSDLSVRSWGRATSILGGYAELGRTISGSYSPTPGQVNPF